MDINNIIKFAALFVKKSQEVIPLGKSEFYDKPTKTAEQVLQELSNDLHYGTYMDAYPLQVNNPDKHEAPAVRMLNRMIANQPLIDAENQWALKDMERFSGNQEEMAQTLRGLIKYYRQS